MRRTIPGLALLLLVGCQSGAVQPIVIDLSARTPAPATPTPAPSPMPLPSPTPTPVGPASERAAGTPEEVIGAQLSAYNRRDLDAFLATYAADAKLYQYPDRLMESGIDRIRERYARQFAESPALHVTISRRIVQGPFVIDQQEVTGGPGGPVRAVLIYQVESGRIVRVTFLR